MLPHQTGYLVFTTNHPPIQEFIMDAGAAVRTSALLMDVLNLLH